MRTNFSIGDSQVTSEKWSHAEYGTNNQWQLNLIYPVYCQPLRGENCWYHMDPSRNFTPNGFSRTIRLIMWRRHSYSSHLINPPVHITLIEAEFGLVPIRRCLYDMSGLEHTTVCPTQEKSGFSICHHASVLYFILGEKVGLFCWLHNWSH